jgi:hypothetical protein
MLENGLSCPLKKAGEMQAAHDQHHRKQQNDGWEIDVVQRLACRDETKSNHADGADDGRSGSINFQAGEFPDCENEIAGAEHDISGKNVGVREDDWRGGKQAHGAKTFIVADAVNRT